MAVETTAQLRARVDRLQRIAFIIGILGMVALGVSLLIEPDTTQFFRSYLFGYMHWAQYALGPLAALLLQYLTGGRWGLLALRPLEASALTVALLGALTIPLLAGLPVLYEWARPEVVTPGSAQYDPIIAFKQPYLNVPFFIIRQGLYFALWIGLAVLLRRWSLAQDRTGDPKYGRWIRMVSGPGLVLYCLALTFFSFDWGMSLEAHWFSTIYGVIYLVGCGITALCLMVLALWFLRAAPPFSEVATPNRIHDFGKLLFAFVILWAYTNFAQYFIIFLGNLPEEITYYLARTTGGWEYVAYAIILLQFIVPFFLLLSRRTNRMIRTMLLIALFLLVMRAIDIYWKIVPAFSPGAITLHWEDVAALVGMGGLFIGAMAWSFKRAPVFAVNDNRMPLYQKDFPVDEGEVSWNTAAPQRGGAR
jgi:hypothetical protein